MNVMTSRFGSLNVQESDVVRLTEGLVGFRSSTQFLLLADQKVDGLYWCLDRQPARADGLQSGKTAWPPDGFDIQSSLRATSSR